MSVRTDCPRDGKRGAGEFERDTDYIPDRITRDAAAARSTGPSTGELWPVEPGRYRLVAARPARGPAARSSCAQLLGLEDVISLGLPGPTHDERSWTFDLDPGGATRCSASSGCRRPTSPGTPTTTRASPSRRSSTCPSGQVVTNDFPWITHDLFFEWREHHRPDAPDLWPADLRDEMDEVMERVYTEVNNGVYRCGFAGSQEAYDAAYDRLWTALDWLEERLTDRRYLMGDALTEADVRLFTTLVRFDAVYHGHFKCNRQKLTELPALWGYARDLFQTPGFGDTVDFDQIKRTTTSSTAGINPTGDRARGPGPDRLDRAARPRPRGRRCLVWCHGTRPRSRRRPGRGPRPAAAGAGDHRHACCARGGRLAGHRLAGPARRRRPHGHRRSRDRARARGVVRRNADRRAALDVRPAPRRGARRAGQRLGAAGGLRLPARTPASARLGRPEPVDAGPMVAFAPSAWSPTPSRWRC